MSDFIPAGRLSAIPHGDQKIEIQTEFSKYPEPRIATSVSIGGRTIHKIQKLWGKTIDSAEEMHQVEEIINSQHDEVTALVHEHAGVLVKRSETDLALSVAQTAIERAESIPEIDAAYIIQPDGKIQSRGKVSREAEMLALMIQSLADVLFNIARVGNIGNYEDCVLNLGAHDVLFLPFRGGYLVALTDAKVRKREIFNELWKIARAA